MKNTKGFIALFAALAAVVLVIVGCIPFTPFKPFDFPLWSNVNLVMGIAAAVLCVVAIVFAILSFRHKDKTGPRKSGMIIAIICLFTTWIPMLLGGFCGQLVDYTNGNSDNIVAQAMKEYQEGKKDNVVQTIIDGADSDKTKQEYIDNINKIIAEHDKNAK